MLRPLETAPRDSRLSRNCRARKLWFIVITEGSGVSLTIVERGDPLDDPDYRGAFKSVRRIWLGDARDVDWLHDEVESRLGLTASGWFTVTSKRHSAHVGAGAEVATVILELVGAGVAGKIISDLIDYAKERVREEAEKVGLPNSSPDFSTWAKGTSRRCPSA